MNLKSDTFELEINRDYSKKGIANQYYIAQLISGKWPIDIDLITYCDNHGLNLGQRHFGGNVEWLTDTKRRVTVYID